MSKSFNASINITRLFEAFKAKHSAFSKSEKTGEMFCNLTLFINDQPDQYDNDGSIKLNSKKEKREAEKDLFKKGYVGNFKANKSNEPAPINDSDTQEYDDLPF